MNVIKLAFCGKMRSGKSSLENYASVFYDFQTFALATEGKALVHQLFPDLPANPKPRKYYQEIIDGMTKFPVEGASDIWIDAELRKIDRYIDRRCCKESRVLITDLRKQREYERLKAEGFVLIRITAPDHVRIERAKAAGDAFSAEDLAHSTELAVDDFEVDYEIVNDGALVDLYEKFDAVMAEVGVGKRY